jgi:DNA-binding response OmpR family regulator
MPKVLIIEDDREINELLVEYVRIEHFTDLSALDGRTGLAAARNELPDAIVLDAMLPDVDGFEVCQQLSMHRATAGIPVIMLTCMNQECDRLRGFASGAFRYMNKPFLPDDLISQLQAAFEWKSGLAGRPPRGRFDILANNREPALLAIHELTADLFAHSTLGDAAVTSISEGFKMLVDVAKDWSLKNKRDLQLTVEYAIIPGAGRLEWIISEKTAGLLSQMALCTASQCQPVNSAWNQCMSRWGVSRFDKDQTRLAVRFQRQLSENPAQSSPVSSSISTAVNGTPHLVPQL